jgi:capsule biosynthesis phosphatase
MRIVVDLDGTICSLRKDNQDYDDVELLPGAIQKLHDLKQAGHYIIIHTARHMKTCNGIVEEVEKRIGDKTHQWLKKHNVPFDELIFGKPYGHLYIDDLSLPFRGWDDISPENFDTEKINVVIPMAGLGSRFASAGYAEIKPFIQVKNEPMIKWALKSLSFLPSPIQLIFIILKEHENTYNVSEKLHDLFGRSIKIIITPTLTEGQAASVALAKDMINNQNKLFIFNCDTFSQTPNLWTHIVEKNPDGTIVCFHANDARYSYAALDQYMYVRETTEKKVISNFASNGLYYFRHGFYFIDAYEKMKKEHTEGEMYVAPLYNYLIKNGKKVTISMTEKNWVLGTPEEKDYFEKHYGT